MQTSKPTSKINVINIYQSASKMFFKKTFLKVFPYYVIQKSLKSFVVETFCKDIFGTASQEDV